MAADNPLPSNSEVSAPIPCPVPSAMPYYGKYDENGVDLTLLRELLALSPLQRLRHMEQHARATQLLNEYGRRLLETAPIILIADNRRCYLDGNAAVGGSTTVPNFSV